MSKTTTLSQTVKESMAEKRLRTCKHFNGTQNGVCKVGVEYKTVEDYPPEAKADPNTLACQIPCTSGKYCRIICEKKDLPTLAEVNAEIERIENSMRQYSEVYQNNICPNHKIPITKQQVGRCIYANPCGCRLGQGKLSEAKKSV